MNDNPNMNGDNKSVRSLIELVGGRPVCYAAPLFRRTSRFQDLKRWRVRRPHSKALIADEDIKNLSLNPPALPDGVVDRH